MLQENIKKLVQYGINCGLTPECERIYTTNLLLECMKEDEYTDPDCDLSDIVLEDVLKGLLDEAINRGIIEDSITDRDLFDTKLMNQLCPRPSQVIEKFYSIYNNEGPQAATDFFYSMSRNSDYIRTYRVKKYLKWTT